MQRQTVKVIVDRPLGSTHPDYPNLHYPINYGYVPGIIAKDGEEQDVYIMGVDEPIAAFEGELIAIVHRKNDAEDKWVVAKGRKHYTVLEIAAAVSFTEQYFETEIELL